MTRASETILDEAATWHAALLRDDMDWDGFTSWLEADPRHQAAFDEVALADRLLAEHAGAVEWPAAGSGAANDDVVPTARVRTRRSWIVAGLAASLALVLAVPQFINSKARVYRSEGQAISVALGDGSSVMLAPRSRLMVEGDGTRLALEGAAWFDIRHDPSRTLSIASGGLTITDIGTRFDVQTHDGQLRVEMEEGEVTVKGPDLSFPLRLVAGKSLTFDRKAGTALVDAVADADVGEWRTGRLSYDATPLPLVAEDLTRYAGVRVDLGRGLADRQFSGTLVIGDGHSALQDLAQLMDARLSGGAGRYRLDPQR